MGYVGFVRSFLFCSDIFKLTFYCSIPQILTPVTELTQIGFYSVTATPFSEDFAMGDRGEDFTVLLRVIDSSSESGLN